MKTSKEYLRERGRTSVSPYSESRRHRLLDTQVCIYFMGMRKAGSSPTFLDPLQISNQPQSKALLSCISLMVFLWRLRAHVETSECLQSFPATRNILMKIFHFPDTIFSVKYDLIELYFKWNNV